MVNRVIYSTMCWNGKQEQNKKSFAKLSKTMLIFLRRCVNPDDATVKILTSSSDKTKFQWENEAFRYFGRSDEIYVHCDILVCIGSSSSNGCTRCKASKFRKRRDVVTTLKGTVNLKETKKEISIRSTLILLVSKKSGE